RAALQELVEIADDRIEATPDPVDDARGQRDLALRNLVEQALDLGDQQAGAGNVDDRERAARLVGRGARGARRGRAVGARLDRPLQIAHRVREGLADLFDAPRQRLESGRHDRLRRVGIAGDVVGSRHHETLNRATEFLSSCDNSESWRIEPAVCRVPSEVCSVTSRIRWIAWATVPAEAACFDVVSEKSSMSSARWDE